jgi:hypothetical protein
MIRLLYDTTIGGIRCAAGSIINLSSDVETALIFNGNAENLPAVSKPVEMLANSAIAASCTSTSTDEVLASFTIAAGILGVNSILQIEPLWTFVSSANNKICKVKIGGVTVYTATRTTSVKEAPMIVLANRNSLTSQIQPYDNTYVTAGSSMPATYSINFSVNVTVEITGQRAASDVLKLEYYRVLHFVGD